MVVIKFLIEEYQHQTMNIVVSMISFQYRQKIPFHQININTKHQYQIVKTKYPYQNVNIRYQYQVVNSK